MNAQNADIPNPLHHARAQLQEILREHASIDPKGTDTGTLTRMLVHMDNIDKSVSASTQDHANAAKRLIDFANTLERMSENLSASFPKSLGLSMLALRESLRAVSKELGSGGPPAWASASPAK